jgi:predicted DNA-binding transcriptional regulator YafY
MQSPAERLLSLLSLLQSRPHWTAEELADRLAVTPRTVRRDVTRLRDLGYPVLAEPGPTGGYQLGAGGALPPLLLSDDEAVAVALGLRAAATGGVAGFEDSAIAALAKIEQVLPVRLREQVLALTVATIHLRSGPAPVIDPDLLLTLAQACRRLERLRFQYEDRQGQVTERRVEPFRLVSTGNRWYLVADDLDRADWRTFRVDRVSNPVLTGHRFTRTEEPDAASMVANALSMLPYGLVAEVMLRAEPSQAAMVIPRTVGSLEPAEGGTRFRVGANEIEWIARYLVTLPFEFEVIDPPELRAALRALGRHLQKSHREPKGGAA